MQKVSQAWSQYERVVMPPNASHVQRQETRRAFYAGVAALLSLMDGIDEDLSDDAGADLLDGWAKEVQAFSEQIKNGRA